MSSSTFRVFFISGLFYKTPKTAAYRESVNVTPPKATTKRERGKVYRAKWHPRFSLSQFLFLRWSKENSDERTHSLAREFEGTSRED